MKNYYTTPLISQGEAASMTRYINDFFVPGDAGRDYNKIY